MKKKGNGNFKNSAKFVIMAILIMMLKKEIIVISLENIETLHIEIVMLILNFLKSQNFCHISQPTKLLFTSMMQELDKFNLKINVKTKCTRKIYGLYYQ